MSDTCLNFLAACIINLQEKIHLCDDQTIYRLFRRREDFLFNEKEEVLENEKINASPVSCEAIPHSNSGCTAGNFTFSSKKISCLFMTCEKRLKTLRFPAKKEVKSKYETN